MSPSVYRKCISKIENACYQNADKNIYNSGPENDMSLLFRPGLPLEAGQGLVFNLLSRETLFHEDFFHAGQVITLKFHSISFYRTAACKL